MSNQKQRLEEGDLDAKESNRLRRTIGFRVAKDSYATVGIEQLGQRSRFPPLRRDLHRDAPVEPLPAAVPVHGHERPECGVAEGFDLGVLVEVDWERHVEAFILRHQRPS